MANVIDCALVQSQVDYANSLYIGMFTKLIFGKLQLVQNTLARVVTLTREWEHIEPSLKTLQWLLNHQYVNFKVALFTYSIRHSGEPQHLNAPLMDYKPTRSFTVCRRTFTCCAMDKIIFHSLTIQYCCIKTLKHFAIRNTRNSKIM